MIPTKFFGSTRVSSYSTVKEAVIQLTKLMAVELASYNIQVNAIAPGWLETNRTAPVKTNQALYDELLLRTPADRWNQPKELAGTAVFLASRVSNFVNGETIRINGGYTIR